ncbi:amidohydrolase [Chitinophaga arvensicola]|uniref:Amidohydrolase 3 domain-containing protein n=1 Tax=Chitinophaga arvensicola TaxID=29529 RepID=A0A1I0S8D3_9BACT|nr:amidohydrolase [Chitinophaga arvensicola]SEW52256.1 hypothetical protein SAMN04488122_4741 [Chitinophaga arvensicola]
MKKFSLLLLLAGSCILFALTSFKKNPRRLMHADVYLMNGQVLTMNDGPVIKKANIVLVAGTIYYVGLNDPRSEGAIVDDQTKKIDCTNKIIMPGFIDAHAHVGQYVTTYLVADLSAPPYGNVDNIARLLQGLTNFKNQKYPSQTPPVIIGNNYDDAYLTGNKHPSKDDLDKVSKDYPIYVVHVSGHMGVANTKMLEILGIDDNTDPHKYPGGTIVKENGRVTGLLMENANVAAMDSSTKLLVPTTKQGQADFQKQMLQNLLAAEGVWFQNGVTTICEGRAFVPQYELLKAANDANMLTGDYIVLPDFDSYKDALAQFTPLYGKYKKHLKVGAIKLTFDGSPQGRDACLTYPYKNPPLGQTTGYSGTTIYTDEQALQNVASVFKNNMPVHIHCNGDSAIKQSMAVFNKLYQEKKIPATLTKNVIVHNQLITEKQLDTYVTLKSVLMPTFFPTHCYLWGNWYLSTVLPPDKAKYISPLKDAQDKGIEYTIHTDSPVTPPDLITAVYAAVTRKMYQPYTDPATGKVTTILDNPAHPQVVSAYEAWKAVTINAADQWGEAAFKGKLKAGYNADLVVLDKNPLDVATDKNINVVYTVKSGKVVYTKK